jgi:hypothetical protein
MPAFSRSSSSRVLVVVGTLALVILVISLTAGGLSLQLGSVRLTARQPFRPFVVALAAWLAAVWLGRSTVRDTLVPLAAFFERRAAGIAVIVAAATLGVGIAYGTYSASSADGSGYVSQSALLADGRTTIDEPLARQVGWDDVTWAFSPLGYRPGNSVGLLVPTYAPGLPLAMAAARRLTATEMALYFVVPLLGAVGVLSTYALGARLHSPIAGLIAAALLATSPIFLFQLVLAMSDVPAASLWTLAMVVAMRPSLSAAAVAGVAAGCATLMRPNLVPLVLPVALLVAGWPRRGPGFGLQRSVRRLATCGCCLAPAIAFLALLQWHLYGDPLRSGYGTVGEIYSLTYVPENARAYLDRLISGELAAIVLGCGAFVAVAVGRRHLADVTSFRSAAWLAALMSALILLGYLPYLPFPDWHFLRFLLPAFPALFVLLGALSANALALLPRVGRGLALLLVLIAVAGVNFGVARREGAFALHEYEARYRTAGRYLESALPANAVIVAVQESGSARYYTGRPVYRWDTAFDLDLAIDRLRQLGRHPVLLVEDFENADLQRRFPQSPIARLDWPPRADFGTAVRVRLFDPADRESAARVVTDRLP